MADIRSGRLLSGINCIIGVFLRRKWKIRFPEGRKLEDVLISHRIVGNSNQIVLTTRPLYLYHTREGIGGFI